MTFRRCRLGGAGFLMIMTFTVSGAGGQDFERYERVARVPGRHALVVGNPKYDRLPPLSSAQLDAERVTESLRSLGFQVMHVPALPAPVEFYDTVLSAFRRQVQPGDIVLFYYSGHGFSFGQYNYLAPRDLVLVPSNRRVDQLAVVVEGVERYLAEKEPSMVVMLIDACRTIPGFQIVDSAGNNMIAKSMNMPSFPSLDVNALLGYATRPGEASQGYADAPELSPFTKSLLNFIATPGEEFTSIFRDVMYEVRKATNRLQFPGIFVYSVAPLYLNATQTIVDQERQLLRAALTSAQHSNVRYFMSRYSTSRFVESARLWLREHQVPSIALGSTRVSPLAVELAWEKSGGRIALPAAGFAFERFVERLDPVAFRNLDAGWIEKAMAHGSVVTTRSISAFARASSASARLKIIPAGRVIKLKSLAVTGGSWIRASVPGSASPLYLQLPSTSVFRDSMDLGMPPAEVMVRRLRTGPRELVDSTEVASGLANARTGHRIIWVSLATGPTTDPAEASARSMRRAHVTYLLKRFGVDARRITG